MEAEDTAIVTDAENDHGQDQDAKQRVISPREQAMERLASERDEKTLALVDEPARDLPVKEVEEQAAEQKIRVKLDGEEKDIPLSDLIKGYQKDTVASARLEKAALREQELSAREESVNALEEQLKNQTATPAEATVVEPDTDTVVDGALDAYLEGDTSKIRQILKQAVAKGEKETATPIPREELDRIVQETLAQRDAAREHATAEAAFKKDYADIFADPDLLTAANKRYFAKIAEGKAIPEAMAEAGKETQEWLNSKLGIRQQTTRETREARKSNLISLPATGARTVSTTDKDNVPEDRSSVIADMRKSRGHGL